MRSMFSAPRYFAMSPRTGVPSTRMSVWRESLLRMAMPTRPIASTVRVTPTSLKMTSSTDFACFFAMSSAVMMVMDCASYFASSCAAFAST